MCTTASGAVFTDVLYLNVGGSKSQTRDFSIVHREIPASTTADLNLDLKGIVWTIAGEYRVASDPEGVDGGRARGRADVGRQANVGLVDPGRPRADSRVGAAAEARSSTRTSGTASSASRDASRFRTIAAGTFRSTSMSAPGQTQLTWQAAAGVSYSYQWGDVIAMWRYLDWKDSSGSPIESLNFNGPMIGRRSAGERARAAAGRHRHQSVKR